MKPQQITFLERAVTGQYQHEEVTVVALLEEGDKLSEAMAELKQAVRQGLDRYAGMPAVLGAPYKETTTPAETPAPKATKKTKAPVEKASEPETTPTPSGLTEEFEKAAVPESALAEEEPPKKKTEKKFVPKPTPYNRDNDTLKQMFTKWLGENHPTWKTAKPDKAKKASVAMNGKDFLDADGKILPSFIAEVNQIMA